MSAPTLKPLTVNPHGNPVVRVKPTADQQAALAQWRATFGK